MSFLTLGLIDVFIYYLRHDLGQSSTAVGYLLGGAGLGAVAGALAAPLLRARISLGPALLCGYLIGGVAVLYTSSLPQLAGAMAGAAFGSFGSTLVGVCSSAMCQTLAPSHLLGRVMSTFWVMHGALGPVGAAALTASVARVGVAVPFRIAGAALIALAVVGAFTALQQRDAAPAAEKSSAETHDGGYPWTAS
jgi:MFS family permease